MLTDNNNDSGSNQDGGGVPGAIDPSPPLSQQPGMLQPNQESCCRSPPAFLTKAYAMVDDPKINSIISWSLSGTSLVIWDHIKLAQEILPKYFKHNNLSSFIYQLNNYRQAAESAERLLLQGFRKIGLAQWEYENQWFQRGKKQLLLNIKRRDKTSRVIKRRISRKRSIDVAKNEVDVDNIQLESLRGHIAAYKEEIKNLKEQQALVQHNISLFKTQIGVTNDNSVKIIKFIAKAFGNIKLKDVIQQIGEHTACEENGEVAENVLATDTDYSSRNNQLMEVHVSIPEGNASRGYQETTFWRKFLVDSYEENEPEPDFVKNQFMLNMELDDMMESNIELIVNESKPPKPDVGEANLRLWN